MNESKKESDFRKAAREEQLWYAGTTMAMNFFLIATRFSASMASRLVIMGASLFLSVYAVLLITNRARKYELEGQGHGYRKPVYQDIFANLWIVLREFEGALFYVLVVFVSCAAVVATYWWRMFAKGSGFLFGFPAKLLSMHEHRNATFLHRRVRSGGVGCVG